MPKKALHVREKAPKGSPIWCGGGRCNDPNALASVSPQKAKNDKYKGYCKRCVRNIKLAKAA